MRESAAANEHALLAKTLICASIQMSIALIIAHNQENPAKRLLVYDNR
jgi:hypothetical protein